MRVRFAGKAGEAAAAAAAAVPSPTPSDVLVDFPLWECRGGGGGAVQSPPPPPPQAASAVLGNSLLLETVATVAHLASYLSARDLCYLAKTCRAVSASLPWSEVAAHAAAASGLGGASGVGCARSMAAWYAKHSLAIDRGTAFGSRLSGAGRTCAELHLGGPQHGLRAAAAEAAEEQDELSLRPSLYRVATAVTSVGFSSRLARSISWSVRLVRLPQLDGVGLWLGACLHDRARRRSPTP